jgi:hypothetical protein
MDSFLLTQLGIAKPMSAFEILKTPANRQPRFKIQ